MSNLCKCPECGGQTINEYRACAGALAQEYDLNESFTGLDTNGMISCNCCDECREKCRMSYFDETNDENK